MIDEEQRFGVEHKEALKKMRTNVDVLTMSATPFPGPRMSLTGIRETSTPPTPLEERHPVLTYVGPTRTSRPPRPSAASSCAKGRCSSSTTGFHDRTHRGEDPRDGPEARVEVAHGRCPRAA